MKTQKKQKTRFGHFRGSLRVRSLMVLVAVALLLSQHLLAAALTCAGVCFDHDHEDPSKALLSVPSVTDVEGETESKIESAIENSPQDHLCCLSSKQLGEVLHDDDDKTLSVSAQAADIRLCTYDQHMQSIAHHPLVFTATDVSASENVVHYVLYVLPGTIMTFSTDNSSAFWQRRALVSLSRTTRPSLIFTTQRVLI